MQPQTRPQIDPRWTFWRRYSFSLVTAGLFLAALVGHWTLGWFAYVDDQTAHGANPSIASFALEAGRDTLENWQSEFLQLVWQVAGLAFLFHVGSSQSEESDERQEAKLDAILRKVDPAAAEQLIGELDRKYARTNSI
jgi:hypothetical protein